MKHRISTHLLQELPYSQSAEIRQHYTCLIWERRTVSIWFVTPSAKLSSVKADDVSAKGRRFFQTNPDNILQIMSVLLSRQNPSSFVPIRLAAWHVSLLQQLLAFFSDSIFLQPTGRLIGDRHFNQPILQRRCQVEFPEVRLTFQLQLLLQRNSS